jgi:hypothetical protein
MNAKVFPFLLLCFISAVFAEDFKTVNGREYKDVTVTRVEPDGIVVKTKSGITKVYFPELPKELQDRFGYHPAQATDYSAQQNATMQKVNEYQVLQVRFLQLQQEEDGLLLQIGQAKEPGPTHVEYHGKHKATVHDPNPLKAQLPLLESHLKDVRHQKDEISKQLQKAQR